MSRAKRRKLNDRSNETFDSLPKELWDSVYPGRQAQRSIAQLTRDDKFKILDNFASNTLKDLMNKSTPNKFEILLDFIEKASRVENFWDEKIGTELVENDALELLVNDILSEKLYPKTPTEFDTPHVFESLLQLADALQKTGKLTFQIQVGKEYVILYCNKGKTYNWHLHVDLAQRINILLRVQIGEKNTLGLLQWIAHLDEEDEEDEEDDRLPLMEVLAHFKALFKEQEFNVTSDEKPTEYKRAFESLVNFFGKKQLVTLEGFYIFGQKDDNINRRHPHTDEYFSAEHYQFHYLCGLALLLLDAGIPFGVKRVEKRDEVGNRLEPKRYQDRVFMASFTDRTLV